MSTQPGDSLIELLYDPKPDINRIIDTFISRFNAVYGNPAAGPWDISKEDWQRYEFLGDRVLGLIIAQALFTRREGTLDEGEMTRMLGSVVSNRALDLLTKKYDNGVFSRLIPISIGQQKTFGVKITGGAFEAFIGALYCEVGLDDVTFFVNAIFREILDSYDPRSNVIGALQEYFQRKYRAVPVYRQKKRTGPDNKPVFVYEVLFNSEILGEGTGESIQQAQQAAASQALKTLEKRNDLTHCT
jgi:ribonuclease-3